MDNHTYYRREAIIEDLTRRLNSSKDVPTKAEYLRNMYLVLPYIPEIQPDWINVFDKIAVAPPKEDDVWIGYTKLDRKNKVMLN